MTRGQASAAAQERFGEAQGAWTLPATGSDHRPVAARLKA